MLVKKKEIINVTRKYGQILNIILWLKKAFLKCDTKADNNKRVRLINLGINN